MDGTNEFFSSSLWLSPPGSTHRWQGVPNATAEVAVFHFKHLSMAVESRFAKTPFLRVPLSEQERVRVLELSAAVRRYWEKPSPGMLLCFDMVASALSLMIYEKSGDALTGDYTRDGERVDRALAYYSKFLEENPTLERIASQVGISAVQLRRLFHAKFGKPPKAVFEEIRDRRILQLLTDNRDSLADIAAQTGFSETSALSRAFKTRFGCSPSQWRR